MNLVLPGDENLPQSAAEAEKRYGIPEGILQGLQYAERSNPGDVSPKGAKGPMQFMDPTWKQYGMGRDVNDGPASFDAAARYMKDLHTRFGDWRAAQAAYNGGTAAGKAVARGQQPPAEETRKYLRNTEAKLPPIKLPGDVTPSSLASSITGLPVKLNLPPDATVGQVADKANATRTSALTAFGHAASEGLLPAAGGMAGFGMGLEAGAAMGAVAAPFTGPLAPVTVAVATIGGGIAGAFGGSYAVRTMQDYALSKLPNSMIQAIGMDPETRKREELDHPYVSLAGSWAANLPFMRPGKVPLKQMAAFAGLGGAFEAGKETYYGEPLDPIKIAAAAAGSAAQAKTTKLGEALGGSMRTLSKVPVGKSSTTTEAILNSAKESAALSPQSLITLEGKAMAAAEPSTKPTISNMPLTPNLAQIAPKREYVGKVVDTLGPGWGKEAVDYWNKIAAAFGPRGPLPSSAPIQAHVDTLSDQLYQLQQMRAADKIGIKEHIRSLHPQEFADASSPEMYNYMTDETLHGQQMPQHLQDAYTKAIKPLDDAIGRLYAQAKKLDPAGVENMDPHNPRQLDRKWLDKLARTMSEDPVFGSFARKAGTLNERTMLALEFEDGTRKVVNRDGLSLYGYGSNKLRSRQAISSSAKRPEVGDTIDTYAGEKAKLVQATTDEIEAQTNLKYIRNPLAARLSTLAELRSFIRERQFLDNIVPALQSMGAAIPKSRVSAAPHGFSEVHGDPTLSKYYIHERFAETFQDQLLRRGDNFMQEINNMAVGSMFWNPVGHLNNAFDHMITTIGWDWLKPWQWGSIIRSGMEAWQDVTKLSPDYIRYMESGMGLQYGRLAGEETIKSMFRGIGPSGWKGIAEAWKMTPQKMMESVYGMSRHALWGGSDIMMLTAYKHLASQKGVDILNQGLRNYVETLNPNYRIPSRIGFDAMMKIPGMPEAVAKSISRALSVGMQSRIFNMFGRYHFGQFKALGQTLHDSMLQNGSSKMGRADAISHLAFTGFMLSVVYPFLWDSLAKMVTGNEDAYARRSGATTIPYTLYHILLGDQDVGRLLSEAFNLPPITKALIEIPANRELFTGQHIWEPGDTWTGKAEDVRAYVTGALYQPLREYDAMKRSDMTIPEWIGRQLGMKTKPDYFTDDQLDKLEKAAERRRHKKERDQ